MILMKPVEIINMMNQAKKKEKKKKRKEDEPGKVSESV